MAITPAQMAEEQTRRLEVQHRKCVLKMNAHKASPGSVGDEAPRCPMVWDGIMCWDEAPAGTVQRQRCPHYVFNMNYEALAYRHCETSGDWRLYPHTNSSWTNYTACSALNHSNHSERLNDLKDLDHAESQAKSEMLDLVQNIGYGVSLVALVIAVLIMCFSRLKSKSNTLHLNLFLAFILRAGSSFLKQLLFVQHLGLEKDINRIADGKLTFIEGGLHWECRLLFTVFIYSICVSQLWIFVEGLYLHMLIYRTLSTERNGVRPYIVLGWVLPFAITIPWIFVKAVDDNIMCWNIQSKAAYWVVHAPLYAAVLLNFFFFLNICRVLCIRARSNGRHAGQAKYRQLAKFILVLIPLFGVLYVIFGVASFVNFSDRNDFTAMFAEQIYNSFQGFILALLFCFLNEEVHNEMKRIWWRRKTRRRDSALTRSFMLSSFRRGNSYTPRAPSNKAIHPLRTPSCRETGDANPNPVAKEKLAWPRQLKIRVPQLFGRKECTKDRLVKSFSDTPPFMVGDNDLAGLTRAQQEEVEARRILTQPNQHTQDLEDISG
ncbi:hypothetical protein EGW08_011236 [Elysia chlorotica]|uniref:G-protein coupled receptors family 2 profile 2 domain-containing protein n=1 Tax=Elysia chlorotica TaxID=188477 RepID=A0A433THD5_ELYCH|nr:hypothetical protein EGW08_011236 [Elysia chlorotica]